MTSLQIIRMYRTVHACTIPKGHEPIESLVLNTGNAINTIDYRKSYDLLKRMYRAAYVPTLISGTLDQRNIAINIDG